MCYCGDRIRGGFRGGRRPGSTSLLEHKREGKERKGKERKGVVSGEVWGTEMKGEGESRAAYPLRSFSAE